MTTKKPFRRWLVLFALMMVFVASSNAQGQIAALAPTLMQNMNLTVQQFSSIATSPMIPAILFSIISGILADRFGAKRIVLVALIVGSVATVLRINATAYMPFFFLMLLGGFAPTTGGTVSAKLLGSWFDSKELLLVMGIYSTAGTLFQAVGTSTGALFPSTTSAFTLAAGVYIAATIAWALFAKNRPDDAVAQEEKKVEKADDEYTIIDHLKCVMKSKNIWLVCIGIMATVGASVIMQNFLPTALNVRHGIDMVKAASIGSMFSVGNMIGALVGPMLISKLGSRPALCIIGIGSAIGIAFAWMMGSVPVLFAAILLTGIVAGAPMPFFFSAPMMIPEIGPAHSGTGGGLVATLQLVGAVVIPTYIITPITGDNYGMMFAMAGVIMLLVFLVGILLPDFTQKNATK